MYSKTDLFTTIAQVSQNPSFTESSLLRDITQSTYFAESGQFCVHNLNPKQKTIKKSASTLGNTIK